MKTWKIKTHAWENLLVASGPSVAEEVDAVEASAYARVVAEQERLKAALEKMIAEAEHEYATPAERWVAHTARAALDAEEATWGGTDRP